MSPQPQIGAEYVVQPGVGWFMEERDKLAIELFKIYTASTESHDLASAVRMCRQDADALMVELIRNPFRAPAPEVAP